jgi:hypothetical protein
MFPLYLLLNRDLQPWNDPYVDSTTPRLHKWMIDDLGVLPPSLAPKGEPEGVVTERKLVTSYKVDAILRAFVTEEKLAVRLLV